MCGALVAPLHGAGILPPKRHRGFQAARDTPTPTHSLCMLARSCVRPPHSRGVQPFPSSTPTPHRAEGHHPSGMPYRGTLSPRLRALDATPFAHAPFAHEGAQAADASGCDDAAAHVAGENDERVFEADVAALRGFSHVCVTGEDDKHVFEAGVVALPFPMCFMCVHMRVCMCLCVHVSV